MGSEVKDITDDLPFEIPDSWVWCRLNDIASISAGGTPERHNPRFWANGTIPWLKISDITSANKYVKHASEYINVEGLENSSAKILPKGTLLYTIFATIGEVGILDFDASCNQAIAGVQLFNTALRDYLYYHLVNLQAFMMSISKGCAQFNINQKILKAVFVPLPPLAEQVRIVAEIEKFEPLIAEYDKLEQQATKLDDEIYDKLKKSILQYAIQGKLVPQDPNDEPASVLIERIRAEKKAKLGKKYVDSYIYKGDDNCYYEKVKDSVKEISEEIPFEIPESWRWIRVDNLFQHNTGKALNSSNSQGVLHPYITTSNVYWGYFNLEHVKEMAFTKDEFAKCSIVPGDLLVCEGGDVGRAAIWDKDIPMCIQNHIHRLRTYYPVCTAFYYFVFFVYKSIGLIGGKGIGIQGLSSGALGKLIFPLPPLAEQERIIKQVAIILNKLKDEV